MNGLFAWNSTDFNFVQSTHEQMNEPIKLEIIGGFDKAAITQFQPSALEAAVKERDRLLAKNKDIITCSTQAEADLIAKALRANSNFADAVEEARVERKAPVLELGRRIDTVASTITNAINADVLRFSKMLGSWQAEQNRLAQEAKQKAWEEEQRIKRESERKEREERDRIDREARERFEKERKEQEELHAKAARARSEAGRERAEKEAADLREKNARAEQERIEREKEEAEKRKLEEKRKIVDVRIEVATSAPVMNKPAGIATRSNIKFEVTNIEDLYKANPLLVKLVPETALIKAALKKLPDGATLPGVKHWEEHASSVR